MERLRKWRKDKGLTLAAAGASVGCSAVQWFRLEKGLRPVTAEMAVKIESATDIPRHDLRPDLFERNSSASAA